MSTIDASRQPATPLRGPVLIVGAGLIGTSIAHALTRSGVDVHLRDANPTHTTVAASTGAGSATEVTDPQLVVVATPPDTLGPSIVEALGEFPDAVVTDTGSVKVSVLDAVRQAAPTLVSRYVGGHPMAGSERGGPLAASADLFDGRTWAVAARDDTDQAAVELVSALATTCGASVIAIDTYEHDRAVALVSHLPHLVSALMAGRLAGRAPGDLELSGQGVRDVTRIAAGDPVLWRQIVTANQAPLLGLLDELQHDLEQLRQALAGGAADDVHELLARGVAGSRAVPGKHGGPPRAFATVTVSVPDRPGELARLFGVAEQVKVSIEDVRIDHDPARETGTMELAVLEEHADRLVAGLVERGWTAYR